MSRYLHVTISAPTKPVADEILDSLVTQKLASGGLISHDPTRFWWDGDIVEQEYFNISTFTVDSKRDALIETVERISPEETPIVAISPLDGNTKFLQWIEESLR